MRDAAFSYKRIMAGPTGNDDNRQDFLKKPGAGREKTGRGAGIFSRILPAFPVFWGRYPVFLKIRQIHNIFIPLWFQWNEIVLRIGYGTGLQEILLWRKHFFT
jgi:hypothetical protein